MLGKPGSGGVRATRPARRKTQESAEDLIRAHGRTPSNKKCADCNTKMPQCVNTTVGTYICLTCSGIHRELNMRVKGIAASSFTMEEAERMQSTDNDKVNALFLARYSPSVDRMQPPEDNHDEAYVRQWIRRKYQEKAWYQPEPAKPTVAVVPPKKEAPPADDLLNFDAAPAANNQKWDAFGGGAAQQPAAAAFPADFGGSTANGNGFPADFGSTQTNDFANFGAPHQESPALSAKQNFAISGAPPSQQQQVGRFGQQPATQQQFGQFGQQSAPATAPQGHFGQFGGQQPQSVAPSQMQFGNFGAPTPPQQPTPPHQQQFGNFGGQQPLPPQQQQFGNFGGSPAQHHHGSFEEHQSQRAPPQQQQFGNFGGQAAAQQFGNFGGPPPQQYGEQQPSMMPSFPQMPPQQPGFASPQEMGQQPPASQMSQPGFASAVEMGQMKPPPMPPQMPPQQPGFVSPEKTEQHPAPSFSVFQSPTPQPGFGASQPSVGDTSTKLNAIDDAFSNMSVAPPAEEAPAPARKMEVSKYQTGETVIYRSSSGEMIVCSILKVHFDHELDPFYTITLPDGREKQTDDAHLASPDTVSTQISTLLSRLSPSQLNEVLEFITQLKGVKTPVDTPQINTSMGMAPNGMMGGISSMMSQPSSMPPAPPPMAPIPALAPMPRMPTPASISSIPAPAPMPLVGMMGGTPAPMPAPALMGGMSTVITNGMPAPLTSTPAPVGSVPEPYSMMGGVAAPGTMGEMPGTMNAMQSSQGIPQPQGEQDGMGIPSPTPSNPPSMHQQIVQQQAVPPPPIYQQQPQPQMQQQMGQPQYMQQPNQQQIQQQYMQQQMQQQYMQQQPPQQIHQQYAQQPPQQHMQQEQQYVQQPPQQQMQQQGQYVQHPPAPGAPPSPKGNPFDMY